MSGLVDSIGRFRSIVGKADALVKHCFYMITMGKWPAGSKLPAIRHIESEWSLNRQTILKAFKTLADVGIVLHKPNSGYYVVEADEQHDYSRDRTELENLYEEICARIESKTELLPLGALRFLVEIAERRTAENPVVAFVECSRPQAQDHAREITERLRIPVLPLSLDEIEGKPNRVSSSVKTVLTTSFHAEDVKFLGNPERKVVHVPIQISSELISDIKSCGKKVTFLESSEKLAHRTSYDAGWMMGIDNPEVEVVRGVEEYLKKLLKKSSIKTLDTLCLVSQKNWECLGPEIKSADFVRPITCELSESAWPIVVTALNIPFGHSL